MDVVSCARACRQTQERTWELKTLNSALPRTFVLPCSISSSARLERWSSAIGLIEEAEVGTLRTEEKNRTAEQEWSCDPLSTSPFYDSLAIRSPELLDLSA